MKNFTASIRTHLIIMIVLYGCTWIILNNVVMQQQKRLLKEYREKKEKIEYDYLRLKNYNDYVQTIQNTINQAKIKLNRFYWLNTGYDPNLLFFQHISSLAEKTGIQIISLQPVDRNNEKYYFWHVFLKGSFFGIFNLIDEIESSEKYLRIESIEVTNTTEEIEVTLKVSGIKKLE